MVIIQLDTKKTFHSTDANSNNAEHNSDAHQKRHKVYTNKPKRVIDVNFDCKFKCFPK